ncbi:sensor histidine kinase [Brachybacterium sacelli]|uniref:histidine kinase n=1 Tax=Brachybacterium sacelli TaxID=173364 RepID=A0ABS4X135_9MICO|nr:HAMP domain-containing sensor histidine kinase [Brachybacterium sacelli]MBP2382096.1 two-component system OmpR family sensor kinase [Brachybacterium sacelli]
MNTPARSHPETAPRPRRRRRDLRTTLVAVLVATVAVVCLAVGIVTHASLRTQLDAELDAQLHRAADRAVDRVQHAAPDGGPAGAPEPLPSPPSDGTSTPEPESGEFELTAHGEDEELLKAVWRDPEGTVHALSAEDVTVLEEALDERGDGPPTTAPLSIGTYRVVARDLGDGTLVVTGLPTDRMRSTLLRLDLTLLGAGAAALVVTGIGGSSIIRRTLRPLDGVAQLASEVARTPLEHGSVSLERRVPAAHTVPGTEVGDVGRALNHLLDNVEGAIEVRQHSEEAMRRFIADASHELRTPLTAIRGYAEMLRLTEDLGERGLQSIDRLEVQSARMTALVEDLLLLTRLDEHEPRPEEDVDLGEIVMESVMDARAAGGDHPVDVRVPDDPVVVPGDPRQLTQILVNLLSNARKHTPAGTGIDVRLREADGRAELVVADAGPGIDPGLVPEVFSRFTRADRARSGAEGTTGLGLSIARAITEAHGGTIDLASRPGRTVFTVSLPLVGA